MGIINANLTHYVMDHPELRPVAHIEAETTMTTLTVSEWTRCYDAADEENAFSCLARDWNAGPRTALYRLSQNDIRNHAEAIAIAEETRSAIVMIRSGSFPNDECDAEDYPRLVALLQICEEYPDPATDAPMSAIDRFTSGLITWARLVEECLESERDEASVELMTDRERQHKIDELDTLIAFLREELSCFAARNRDTEGARFRATSIVRLAARRHMLALAS